MTPFMRRFVALLRKETRQLLRDRSNLAVGLVLPVVLILLFGYGLSFDVTRCAGRRSSSKTGRREARAVVAGLQGSPYIAPVWLDQHAGGRGAHARSARSSGIVRVPVDFARQLAAGHAQIQLLVNGVDTNTAATIESYVTGAIGMWGQRQADRAGTAAGGAGSVVVVPRMWFNEASSSTWYLVPGLMVAGADADRRVPDLAAHRARMGARHARIPVRHARAAAGAGARQARPVPRHRHDRPVRVPAGRAISSSRCRFAGRSLAIVASSLLYLTVSLSLGLFISGATRNQFLASQMALLASFMPALMLSGFIFDLRNVPVVDSDRQPGPAGDALHGADEDAVPGRRQLGDGRPQLFHPGALRVHPDRGVATEPAKAAGCRRHACTARLHRARRLSVPQRAAGAPHGSAEPRDDLRCRPYCSRCSSAMGRPTT